MSHADWTPSPVVEREAALVRRRWRLGEFNVVGAALSTIAAFASFTVGIDRYAESPLLGVLLFGLATLLGLLVVVFVRWDNARLDAVTAPDRARWEEFGSREGWLVELIVLQGDAPTGRDRGILWIEGARLNFAGDRCSFSLAPGDLAGACRSERSIQGLRLGMRIPLRHETGGGRLALSMKAQGRRLEGAIGLRRDVDAFARRETLGLGQLPPTALGPGASSKLALFVGASGMTGFVLFSGVFTVLAAITARDALSALIVLSIVLCGVWNVGGWTVPARWRAWRDRRRLR